MSKWTCPQCQAVHGCSCAARIKNGVTGCTQCVHKTIKPASSIPSSPQAPTNVNAVYTGKT